MLICSLPAHRHTGRNAQLYPRLQPACTQTYRPRCSTVSQTAACLHTDIQAEMLNCIPDCSLPAHRHTGRDAQLYPRLQPACTQTYRPRCSTVSQTAACLHTDIQAEILTVSQTAACLHTDKETQNSDSIYEKHHTGSRALVSTSYDHTRCFDWDVLV
ncbi:hypothetical protein RRG08_061356 [Elysia crispata]|uniref:Uncharacterized protein n=1 Tax=Elysia crispata TaxID=231223 RepID=A0AAE1AFX3_9GAST|nr:hypothetical protein RRG08_061356 [Elysia crispata]